MIAALPAPAGGAVVLIGRDQGRALISASCLLALSRRCLPGAEARVKSGCDPSGGNVVHVAGDTHLWWEQRRAEQALDVGLDGRMRVGNGGGLERCLGEASRRRSPVPEAGVGEKTGSALRVVDDRDF